MTTARAGHGTNVKGQRQFTTFILYAREFFSASQKWRFRSSTTLLVRNKILLNKKKFVNLLVLKQVGGRRLGNTSM